jgi:hypothetical protein
MTARFQNQFNSDDMDGVPVKLYEGTVTRSDVVKGGLVIEDVAVYSAPCVKGDLVKFYSDSSNPGVMVMEKVTLGSNEVNDAHGRLVDDPIGADDTTASSGTPINALRRTASVKMFGHRIEEFDNTAAGALRAGYSALFSEAAEGVIEGSATLANGVMVIAAYTAASGIVPCLMGYYGFHPGD